jgi:hypothetical protein
MEIAVAVTPISLRHHCLKGRSSLFEGDSGTGGVSAQLTQA